MYRTTRGAQFAVFKVTDSRYPCQFIYTDADHYGTGRNEYEGLSACVLTLLRVQPGQERDSCWKHRRVLAAVTTATARG